MDGDSPWWSGLALALLGFLTQVRPWHMIAAGIVGAAICIIVGRARTTGLVGAAVCVAVAAAGIALEWRSSRAPQYIPIVTARTVGAQGGDDPVDWKLTEPYSLLLHSRRPDDGLWIDGIQIFAKNLSDRPLENLTASVGPHSGDKKMKMTLELNGRRVDWSEAQTVPAKSDFSLVYVISSTVDDRTQGMSAEQFLRDFGNLYFSVRYDINQIFARSFSAAEIERKIAVIEQDAGNAGP